jgi:hypothetical protein
MENPFVNADFILNDFEGEKKNGKPGSTQIQ